MAESTNLSVMDNILSLFTTLSDAGIERISPHVMWLFFSLATLALVWQHIKNMSTQRAHPIGLLFAQLITVGFFVWLLTRYEWITTQFYLSMIKLGLTVGGLGHLDPAKFGNPSSLLKIGLDVARPMIDAMGLTGWFTGTNAIMGVCMFVVIASFFIVAFQVFVAILEFKLGLIWCFLMISMGILKQTSFATEKALGYIFASGMKLFAIATITSIGSAAITELLKFSASPTYNEAFSVAFGSLTIGLLSWFGPSKIAGVVSGGPSLGAGSLISTALAFGSLLGGAATGAMAAGGAAANATSAVANAAKSMGVTEALGGAMKSGAQNLANTQAGRVAMAGATIMAAKAQGMAAAAMPSGPAGQALRMAGGAAQKAGGAVAQAFREAGSRGATAAPTGTAKAAGLSREGITPEMKSNPILSADALERINSIERRYETAKRANGGTASAATEHARTQAYRGLAWDIGSAIQDTNPGLFQKIDAELERVYSAQEPLARQGVPPAENSRLQGDEYRNVVNRALNLDGGGGYDKAQVTSTMTPEGQKQNAAALASLGVGQEVRALAAKGMGNREIATALGEKLKPIEVQAGRLGKSDAATEMKLQAISDFKAVNGIPGRNDAGFKAWASNERKMNAPVRVAQAPAPQWASNANRFRPPSIRSMMPNGTERSGGIVASGSTPGL